MYPPTSFNRKSFDLFPFISLPFPGDDSSHILTVTNTLSPGYFPIPLLYHDEKVHKRLPFQGPLLLLRKTHTFVCSFPILLQTFSGNPHQPSGNWPIKIYLVSVYRKTTVSCRHFSIKILSLFPYSVDFAPFTAAFSDFGSHVQAYGKRRHFLCLYGRSNAAVCFLIMRFCLTNSSYDIFLLHKPLKVFVKTSQILPVLQSFVGTGAHKTKSTLPAFSHPLSHETKKTRLFFNNRAHPTSSVRLSIIAMIRPPMISATFLFCFLTFPFYY